MNFVTTFSRKGFQEYGRRFVESFCKYSTHSLNVVLETDFDRHKLMNDARAGRIKTFEFGQDACALVAQLRSAERLYRRDPGFKEDCARFAWKVLAIDLVSREVQKGVLIWIDADSLVDYEFDQKIDVMNCADDEAVRYWGRVRHGMHVEAGLLGFNLAAEFCWQAVARILNAYRTLQVFRLREWHDGYLWGLEFYPRRDCIDLSERYGLRSSNPLFEYFRGRGVTHLKGARKSQRSLLIDKLRLMLGR